MLTSEEKNYLTEKHGSVLEQIRRDVRENGICLPLYIYAFNPSYLSDEDCKLIENHLDEILDWGKEFRTARRHHEAESTECLKQFPLVLILFHIRRFYEKSDGRSTWKCIQQNANAWSTFGLILANNSNLGDRKKNHFLPEITKGYGDEILLNENILRALHCFDEQFKDNRESYNYTEFFRYHCPFLKAEEQGQTAGRLKTNEKLFNQFLANSTLFSDTWAELCERADSNLLAEECRRIAQDIISQECDDQTPKDENGHLHPIIVDSSYIHALLQYAPMEYFLSLKALCSEENAEGYGKAQAQWPWLRVIWGKAIDKIRTSFTWQLYHEDKNTLSFILYSSLEKSVLLKQGGLQHEFYRPQIIAADLERCGFNLSEEIEVFESGGNHRKIGLAAPLPSRAAYLLPEHPGQTKTGRDVCESDNLHPALYRRRLYLISTKKVEPLLDEQGKVMSAQAVALRLKNYKVQLFLLNAPPASTTTEFCWGNESLYIHMPARPEIPDSNGYDDIEVCRCSGVRMPHCIQKITAEEIDGALDSNNPKTLITLLSADEKDRLPFLSYTARLEKGAGAAQITLASELQAEETEREFRHWGNDFNIIPRDDGYLIEKLVQGEKSPERYFISRVLPNAVSVKCRLRFHGNHPLDRAQDCLLFPHNWQEQMRPANVQLRYHAARRLNGCNTLQIGNKDVTIERRLKEQVCFILTRLVHPVEGCADNDTALLKDLSVHIFPDHDSAEALGVKPLAFTLRYGNKTECVTPHQGEQLQELFCRCNVPFMEHCELRHGESLLFSGLFEPSSCCATKEAVYLPDGSSKNYALKLLHESRKRWRQTVSNDTMHQCSTLLRCGGYAIDISDVVTTFFPDTAEQAGWYCLVVQFDNGTEIVTPCFYRGGHRIIDNWLIQSFHRYQEEFERDWPELAAEIRALTAQETRVENTVLAVEAPVQKQYPFHDAFLRDFANKGWGYIDCDGRFTRTPGKQIPLRRFFLIEGEADTIVSAKYNKDGTYTYTKTHRNYHRDRSSVKRDFDFACHPYKGWYERNINGEETVYPMMERWLKIATHELPQLCYRDMKELGAVWERGAVWLESAQTDVFKSGYSLIFQIAKRLWAQEQRKQASLLLLSLRNVMKNWGVSLENKSLQRRMESLETELTEEETTAVGRCMNLIHWLLIHY